ncbi:hypothetical protein LOK49_LG01G03204 [Camellia lanceoleosa]|uniref:Uncharacterized protein n=1 Tax=Camellia lanceoleosa TaxID=1840588 RepID=A0ACC0J339_9ERIC|nr:hypothetical protein LOK49_LG01G03204 [Camellia lanceoleosa]
MNVRVLHSPTVSNLLYEKTESRINTNIVPDSEQASIPVPFSDWCGETTLEIHPGIHGSSREACPLTSTNTFQEDPLEPQLTRSNTAISLRLSGR